MKAKRSGQLVISVEEKDDLCDQLDHLMSTGVLEGTAQNRAAGLVARLESDIRVVLAGPDVATISFLLDVFEHKKPHQMALSVTEWPRTPDFTAADMCIWCTARFDEAEAAAWQEASDRLKDHSFLVLGSHVDQGQNGTGRARIDHLEDIASDDFYGLFQIPTTPTRVTQSAPAVALLIDEVEKLVLMGMRADADNALMFVSLHQPKLAGKSRAPLPARLRKTAKPTTQTLPVIHEDPLKPIFQTALNTIHTLLPGFEPHLDVSENTNMAQILSVCSETSMALADVFSNAKTDVSEFAVIKEDILTAADRILLLSLEADISATTTAVTTLLQLKREFEVRVGSA